MWNIWQVPLIEIMPVIISDATAVKEKTIYPQLIEKLMFTVNWDNKLSLATYSRFNRSFNDTFCTSVKIGV